MLDAPMINNQQPQTDMTQQVASPSQDDLTLAKQALGLDKMEQQYAQINAQLQAAQEKAMFNEVASRNPDVDIKLVEQEIAKVAQDNPALAQQLRSNEMGIDMLFKKVASEMQPKHKPDEITDSGESGGDYSFSDKIKNGSASEIDLGDYILGANA